MNTITFSELEQEVKNMEVGEKRIFALIPYSDLGLRLNQLKLKMQNQGKQVVMYEEQGHVFVYRTK